MTREQACEKARIESENGYVQHVNRSTDGETFVVSDWFDCDDTSDSFENGKRIGGIDRFVDIDNL